MKRMRNTEVLLPSIFNDEHKFLVSLYYYADDGLKKRFTIPKLVSGANVLGLIANESKRMKGPVFKVSLHYTDFPHVEQVFNEICLADSDWRTRIERFETRVPYLFRNVSKLEELAL
jgi:hypothetical protein